MNSKKSEIELMTPEAFALDVTRVAQEKLKAPTMFYETNMFGLGTRGVRRENKIMKILNYVSVTLITVVIACSLAASTTIQAQRDDARLVVSRSANFGTFQYLILYVDGFHVANLGVNQSYEAVLSPGRHVLSVTTTPNVYRSVPPIQRRVNTEPGATYAFTAFWKNYDEAYLEKTGTQRVITPSNPG